MPSLEPAHGADLRDAASGLGEAPDRSEADQAPLDKTGTTPRIEV